MQALTFVAVVGLILVAVFWLIRKGRSEYQAEATGLGEISDISIEEAERRALVLLQDGRRFRSVESPIVRDDDLEVLADGLRKLFQRYEAIEGLAGSLILDRRMIGASSVQPGYTVIGRGMAGSDSEFELGVRGSEEPVYEMYHSESIDPVFGTYRSVYHWVLAAAREADARRSHDFSSELES